MSLRLACITGEYPCSSEQFVQRELAAFAEMNIACDVYAASSPDGPKMGVCLRPRRLGLRSFCLLLGLLLRPLALLRLLAVTLDAGLESIRDGATLLANWHTVLHFSQGVRRSRADVVYALFLSWPACIGMAVASVCRLPLVIRAHARDLFVEHGAAKAKVRGGRPWL